MLRKLLRSLRFSGSAESSSTINTQTAEHVEVRVSKDQPSSSNCNNAQVSLAAIPMPTPCYKENTLMGLPAELRLLIYKFALQDIIDTIANAPPTPRTIPFDNYFNRPPQNLPLLGGLALPHINRTTRTESLSIYGPLLEAHQNALWNRYSTLHEAALGFKETNYADPGWQAAKSEQDLIFRASLDLFWHFCTVGLLWERVDYMRHSSEGGVRLGSRSRPIDIKRSA